MNAFKVSTAAVASALMLFATTASTIAQTDKGAKQYAPGQERKPGESAKKYAPGQNKPEGESAKDQAPGQQMNKKK
jgi:hypothetical protein